VSIGTILGILGVREVLRRRIRSHRGSVADHPGSVVRAGWRMLVHCDTLKVQTLRRGGRSHYDGRGSGGLLDASSLVDESDADAVAPLAPAGITADWRCRFDA
jgi:hypothetical protein